MLTDIRDNKWVISLYFLQGLPYALIITFTPILYKNFHISNQIIGLYTSLFAIPWLLKPIISPFLETLTTKKRIIIFSQMINGSLLIMLPLFISNSHFLLSSSVLFSLFAFFAATYDIASDGFYLTKLKAKQQAYFVGIRTIAYQLGRLTSQGALIILVGFLLTLVATVNAWRITLICTAMLILCVTVYNMFALPKQKKNLQPLNSSIHLDTFRSVLRTVTHMPYYGLIVFFIFIFNFPEAQLMKMLPLFLLDSANVGGLGFSTKTVGFIYGVLGTLCVILGVTFAGLSTKKYQLKQSFFPITLVYALSTALLVVISIGWLHKLVYISFSIMLIQFFFGFANGLYMVFLLQNFSKGKHPMSLYAIASTLMMLGMIVAGAFSGYIQEYLGYKGFFIWIFFNAFLVLILMIYIELNNNDEI